MTRSVPLWRGTTDDTPVPPRVRMRVFERDGGVCQCGCGTKIMVGMKWETDHRIAIINGGTNDEANLCTLLVACHKVKTAADVAIKAKAARVKAKHIGLRPQSRFACSRDSGWKKKVDGTVVRR